MGDKEERAGVGPEVARLMDQTEHFIPFLSGN